MKTAVFFTGALRTIKKTMRYIKQNVLIHPDVHVFACLQNLSQESTDYWNTWLQTMLGAHSISITWIDQTIISQWEPHREHLLRSMSIPFPIFYEEEKRYVTEEDIKHYLRTFGPMIEYVQLQYAYLAMCHHEQLHRFEYEHIIRIRTDTFYGKPIDFHWLTWTDSEVEQRMNVIRQKLVEEGMDSGPKNVFSYFMSTVLSDDVIPSLKQLLIQNLPSHHASKAEIPSTPYQLNKYLRKGKYILTVRKNLIYVVRRSLFHIIPSLASLYGTFRSPHSDGYWFNSECQFQGACYYSGLTIHDYSSAFEELPIAQREGWTESDYFDADFNCKHNTMLYCVVRT